MLLQRAQLHHVMTTAKHDSINPAIANPLRETDPNPQHDKMIPTAAGISPSKGISPRMRLQSPKTKPARAKPEVRFCRTASGSPCPIVRNCPQAKQWVRVCSLVAPHVGQMSVCTIPILSFFRKIIGLYGHRKQGAIIFLALIRLHSPKVRLSQIRLMAAFGEEVRFPHFGGTKRNVLHFLSETSRC